MTQVLDDSTEKLVQNAWGSLISWQLKQYELSESEVSIGRDPKNTIPINDKRISGTHCILKYDEKSGTVDLEDTSTNGTFFRDEIIGKGKRMHLNHGEMFFILHKS